jgi:hypothetical protein
VVTHIICRESECVQGGVGLSGQAL